jgi:hypothetical protein
MSHEPRSVDANDARSESKSSQIETIAPRRRIVLLGASNLALSLPRVVEASRAAWGAPLEFFVAMGYGRSYGQESKFFGKKFPGILQCAIWDALERAHALPTSAIVADVGNDLAYEAPVDTVAEWVATALDRLAQHNARTALNNVPIESLRTVGAIRYPVLRSLLFPSCRLSRGELLSRAEALSYELANIAKTREIPAFSANGTWYGIDPIHPRRRSAGEIWRTLIGALDPVAPAPIWARPRRADATALRRATMAWWMSDRRALNASPRSARLSDGSTVALF